MFGKFKDGTLRKYTGKPIISDNKVYINPTDDILLELGYKPIVYTDPPEEREGYYQIPTYKEYKERIEQVWEYVLIEEENNE